MKEGLYGSNSHNYRVHVHMGSELDEKVTQAIRNVGLGTGSPKVEIDRHTVTFRSPLTGNMRVFSEAVGPDHLETKNADGFNTMEYSGIHVSET